MKQLEEAKLLSRMAQAATEEQIAEMPEEYQGVSFPAFERKRDRYMYVLMRQIER